VNIIIYTRPDGGISIIIPAHQSLSLARKDIPADATNVREVLASDIPADRYFRNAWRDSGATITIDMVTARGIHRANLITKAEDFRTRYDRLARSRQIRGDSTGATDAINRRNAIDAINYGQLHSRIEGAATPVALRAIVPTELTDEPPPNQNPNIKPT